MKNVICLHRSVTELGSGLGLTGIVTCKYCQIQSYAFTDCHAQVLYLLSKNIEQNLVTEKCKPDSESSDRDRKILRKIRKQLSLSSGGESSCEELNTASADSWEALELDVNNDEIYSDPVELDVSASSWDMDSSHRLATLKFDRRVCVAHLDWECVKGKILEKLKSDIILAAGEFSKQKKK